MPVSCQLVLQCIRDLAPPRFALEGDPTGLQVGTAAKSIDKVLCTLDLTLEVAQEARRVGAGLCVSHHAVIYRPLRDLRTDGPRGKILETLLKGDVAVYVPHTALDVVGGGLNDHLARAAGLSDVEFLKQTGSDDTVLLRASAPTIDEALANGLRGRGALEVTVHGDGEGARLEALVPARRAQAIGRKIEDALGVDVLRFALGAPSSPRGIGRIGYLEEPLSVNDLALRLKERLGAPAVRIVVPEGVREVRKVAVLCGDGRSFIDAASFAGADILVTGDVDHHTALDACSRGMALCDVGHWAGEAIAPRLFADALRERLEGQAVEILVSEVSTQPFEWV